VGMWINNFSFFISDCTGVKNESAQYNQANNKES